MKTNRIKTEINQTNGRPAISLLRACLNTCSAIRDGIETVKEKILQQHSQSFKGGERFLKLALNEAEALAWQTDYPHLVFPVLAAEKATAAVNWQSRQKSIRRDRESAFAA
jgi:hypothetical protein